MIRRIRAIARSIRGKGKAAADITPADAQRLRVLVSAAEWKTFQRLLELMVEQHAEAMLSTEDGARLHYLRGLIVGLRQSTLYAEQIAARETNVRRDRSAAVADRRRAALYATSAWPDASRFGTE